MACSGAILEHGGTQRAVEQERMQRHSHWSCLFAFLLVLLASFLLLLYFGYPGTLFSILYSPLLVYIALALLAVCV